ncbi:MAG: hypothetical protein ACQERZ_05245 [Fusobacteriota bacterium]
MEALNVFLNKRLLFLIGGCIILGGGMALILTGIERLGDLVNYLKWRYEEYLEDRNN